MKFDLPFKLLFCPATIGEVMKISHLRRFDIMEQNQHIAELQATEASRLMRHAAGDNGEAFAPIFKLRRDTLIDIVGNRIQYSWRKRDIAARELKLMGYDVIALDKVEKV